MNKEIKKGILIFPILKDLNQADGILVKNEGIRKGFIQNNVDVDVLEFTTKGVFNGGKQVYAFSANKYRRIYQYSFTVWQSIARYLQTQQYDFLWFRIPLVTPAIARFVQEIKKSGGVRVILEYGAYPFDNELTSLKRLFYQLNRRSELKLHHFSDYVITYCGQEKVDNLVNIPINNGIDIDKIPVVKHQPGITQQINFISVSSLKKWHAYERFLEGLAMYVKKSGVLKVSFHIVGSGPEYEKLYSTFKKYNLQDYVVFHHFKTGIELDEVYNCSHVAIGTLGFHRIGINNSSSLKNREYFARGLPIVLSTPDQDMPADLPFVQYVPEGESAIDIDNIVRFAQEIYKVPHLNEEIRAYAEEKVSWKGKIKTVLNYLRATPARLTQTI